MIFDSIDNLKKYMVLNPLFEKVVEFLQTNDLTSLPTGKIQICGDDLFVNIVDAEVKSKEEAVVETHRKMVDIQIPVSGIETHGYTPLACLEESEYDEQNDITFYECKAHTYFDVHPGEFVIYFPEDGHAPAITFTVLRKAIFKVKN